MQATEREIYAVEEARRRAAAKVRSLLEQLEVAEKEFDALTEKARELAHLDPAPRAIESLPRAKKLFAASNRFAEIKA